ncbi:MAG: ornithine carbamoyltransferase [Spirochaetaceae bacterium]|jgi:ornithine carbamoyltransferase|nr:ornithine carbamoyltransferase [Spirochaetaceae bacterium]
MNAVKLKGRSLLSIEGWSKDEIRFVLEMAKALKSEARKGVTNQRFAGKTLALLFEKRSTRTRCAFETAFGEEGGHPVFLSTQDIQLGGKESIEDTARVLGRMFSAIQFRGFKQSTVEALAQYSGVPVYNGLTDDCHPTQALADIMTFEENFGVDSGKKLVFVGDGRNNVARSLAMISAKLGVEFVIVGPEELKPDEVFVQKCRTISRENGASITCTSDLSGVCGAAALYTDVWVSMGEEREREARVKLLVPYQVNAALMERTGRKDCIFLHCLPAVKGEEVTYDVIDGPQSRAWDEAENRKHTIKALLLATL